MKTRIIHTKIWEDDWFSSISRPTRIIFLYLLTCPQNNLSGMFEMSDRVLSFNAVVTQTEIDKAKDELSGRVLFYKGWVKLLKSDKYNNYINNKDMEKALQKETDAIPDEIKEYFADGIVRDTPRDTPRVYPSNNHKSEIINNNKKGGVGENKPIYEQLQKICDDYQVPMTFVESKWDDLVNYCGAKGKTYRNYYLALRDWVKRDALKIKGEAYGKSNIAFIKTQ